MDVRYCPPRRPRQHPTLQLHLEASRSWDFYVEESVYDTITPDAVTYDTADRTCRLDYNVSTEDWKDIWSPDLITTKLDREAWEEGDAIGCSRCSVDVEGTMSKEECFHAGKTAL